MRVLLTILLSFFLLPGAYAINKPKPKAKPKQHATSHHAVKKAVTHHVARKNPVPEFVKTDTIATTNSVGYVLNILKNELGKPYRRGLSGLTGFDCSGLIQYAFSFVGISLPRTSYDIGTLGEKIVMGNLQPGDLLFFYGRAVNPKRKQIGHVGCVYKVDGDKVYMIHSSEEGVNIVDINNSEYYKKRFISARRIISADSCSNFVPGPVKSKM